MNFSIKTYPTNIGNVNSILESCNEILKSAKIAQNDKNSMNLLVKLLSIPLETLSVQVLMMHNFPTIMNYMKFTNKRTVALKICKAVIKEGGHLSNFDTVD
jgi:hypothetical protein